MERHNMKTFIGVDWKDGECCIIKKKKNDADISYFSIPKSNYSEQVESIENTIDSTDADGVVADIGFGQIQCQMLQNKYGEIVKSCYYSSNHKNKVSYDRDTWMLAVDRDVFIIEAMKMAEMPFKKDVPNKGRLHALNYAYIAMSCDGKNE